MTPRVRVRPARPEEVEAVAALFNALNSMDGPPPPVWMPPEAVRRDLLGADPRAVLLVAELDGELVRMLGADDGDGGARRHAEALRRAA